MWIIHAVSNIKCNLYLVYDLSKSVVMLLKKDIR